MALGAGAGAGNWDWKVSSSCPPPAAARAGPALGGASFRDHVASGPRFLGLFLGVCPHGTGVLLGWEEALMELKLTITLKAQWPHELGAQCRVLVGLALPRPLVKASRGSGAPGLLLESGETCRSG